MFLAKINIEDIDRIEIDPTDFCNLSCPGCPTPQKGTKLDWDKIKPLIEYISKKNKITDITICGNGGEPLLHPNITDIIFDLYTLFPTTKITLATNGEKFKNFNFEKLKPVGKNLLIEWSIDGHTNDIHTITRKNGNLEKIIENFKKYSEPFDNIILTTRHKANESYLNEIYNFILKETKIKTMFRDTTRISKKDNLLHPTNFSSSVVKILNTKFSGSFEMLEKIYNIKPHFNFYFNPDGRLYPCAAFYYNKIKIPELNIYDMEPNQAYDLFKRFSNEYCNFHRKTKECDHTRCCLECGIDRTYKFDSYQEIKDKN